MMLTEEQQERVDRAVAASVKLAGLVKSGEIPREDLELLNSQCGLEVL
jgi:hypothetical protein